MRLLHMLQEGFCGTEIWGEVTGGKVPQISVYTMEEMRVYECLRKIVPRFDGAVLCIEDRKEVLVEWRGETWRIPMGGKPSEAMIGQLLLLA